MGTVVSSIPKQSFDGSAIVSGTVADARIAATIARDTEIATAVTTHATDVDAHHIPPGALEGTLAHFQANAATGTFDGYPQYLNDNNTGTEGWGANINEYAEIDFGIVVCLNQFRQFGHSSGNADGEFKIQYFNLVTHAWVDWVTGIATRVTADWGSWDSSGGEIITDKIRWVVTALDTGQGNRSYIAELEVVYA